MKYHVWTHYDLDGVVSYLNIRWFYPKAVTTYSVSLVKRFRDDWTNWLAKNNIEDYDKIFILDLDISEFADLVDHENVIIIDHHKTHENKYKKAKVVVKEYTSAAKLTYKLLSKLQPNAEISDAQKKLVLLADDYDSYELQLPDSKKLNTIFWETNKSFDSFIRNFHKGFYGFDLQQQNMIKLNEQKVQSMKDNMDIYSGEIKIKGSKRKIVAGFADAFQNDIADYLKNDYNAEVAIVVNKKMKSVSFRRRRENSDLDVSKLAEALTDGGGHEYAAGGPITEKFLEFTKLLKQIK